ncbi:hypothetical protein HDU98_000094 [Podochytrium sp. JEL0797]|nr:hypothetical protein HDU98_000094 [Podochytrium sp. JEL0797]
MQPHHVTRIDRIANPSLQAKFEIKLNEMHSRKSHSSIYEVNQDFSFPEFHHNPALLFHCTKADPDAILSQGLDISFCRGGRLGKGIYFADNPAMSISYDRSRVATLFVFQVVLGDCIFVPYASEIPAKADAQKRNENDATFDSIIGRPNGSANEYVIYDGSQCLPVYSILYLRDSVEVHDYANPLPPFVWKDSSFPAAVPVHNVAEIWKHDSHHVFESMSGNE